MPGITTVLPYFSARFFIHALNTWKTGLCVVELQRFLRVLVVAPVECPNIIGLTSHINSYNQSFFSNEWMKFLRSVCYNLSWISLCLIKFLLTSSKLVILFYSEVSFYPPSWHSLYLYYTESSYNPHSIPQYQAITKAYDCHKLMTPILFSLQVKSVKIHIYNVCYPYNKIFDLKMMVSYTIQNISFQIMTENSLHK